MYATPIIIAHVPQESFEHLVEFFEVSITNKSTLNISPFCNVI